MKNFAFGILGLGLLGVSFWIGTKLVACPPGHVCILQGNTDPSPIIVTDGSSIHFAQFDQWLYENSNLLAALLPGHHAHTVKVQVCTPDAGGTCTDLVNQNVLGKTWSLYLCQTPCNADGSNWLGNISLNKDSTYGGDKGTDVVVQSKTSNFQSEPRTGNGASFYLDTVHFKAALLNVTQDNGAIVPFTADCSASSPPTQACVARICYAGKPSLCP